MPETRRRPSSRSAYSTIMAGAHYLTGVEEAVEAARAEAGKSSLPGGGGGPQDAYRHLLVTAEIARTKGEKAARAYAYLNEVQSEARFAQSKADRRMDDHNNAIGFEIGKTARSWEDVVRLAREKILEAARHGGDGKDGRVIWHNEPADPDWNPDIGNRPIAPNRQGGAEHDYDAPNKPGEDGRRGAPRAQGGKRSAPADSGGAADKRLDAGASGMTPAARKVERFALAGEETLEEILRKPPARLTPGELDRLIADKTVMRPSDPLRGPAEEAVTAAFRHAFPGGSSPSRPQAAQPAPAVSPDRRPVADGVKAILGRFVGTADDDTMPDAVATLQTALNRAAPDLPPLRRDGIFGDRTRARLRGVVARRGVLLVLATAPANSLPPPSRGASFFHGETV